MKVNLLKETLEALKSAGKTEKDVLWVGIPGYYITWENFCAVANKEYNNDYGTEKVWLELLIVGENFWLVRDQYDGKEWWEFREMPKKPLKMTTTETVFYRN